MNFLTFNFWRRFFDHFTGTSLRHFQPNGKSTKQAETTQYCHYAEYSPHRQHSIFFRHFSVQIEMLHPSQNEGTGDIGRVFGANTGIAILAKFLDFHKAITLLLIYAQKWFWYRWNWLSTFSVVYWLSFTCDEHSTKHTDIQEYAPTYARAQMHYFQI